MKKLVLLLLVGLGCIHALPAAEKPAKKKAASKSAATKTLEAPPNVVLILSDDQAWGDYSFMGHPMIQTPRLDRLARESLTFPRGYVPASLCCPSLASIVTGKYPHQHKIANNDPPEKEKLPGAKRLTSPDFLAGREKMNTFMDAQPTMPRLLSEKGYLSLQTGKWWQGDFKRGGFTHGMTKGSRHGDAGLDIGRKTMEPIYEFVRTAKAEKKPFFVWYAPMLPHDPHTPPERLLEKYRGTTPSEHIARYWAMVEWFDETCGQLLDFLEKEEVAKNTIVLYVTDNGWIQDPEKPKYAPRSKQSQYDTGLRTPIMVRWLDKVKPRISDAVVSSLDLLPTVLKACNVPPPKGLPGVNLLDDQAVAARKAIYGECFLHTAIDLDKPETSLRWRWMISDDMKLIVPHAKNEPESVVELYNLKSDPGELTNLATEQTDHVKKLRAMLDAWWKG
jgi:uncharacterized sulfatase